jgi:hypothetical protein
MAERDNMETCRSNSLVHDFFGGVYVVKTTGIIGNDMAPFTFDICVTQDICISKSKRSEGATVHTGAVKMALQCGTAPTTERGTNRTNTLRSSIFQFCNRLSGKCEYFKCFHEQIRI